MISIYKIVDNTNGNIYVGSTCNLIKRKNRHEKHCDCSSKIIIKNNDYYFEVIEECTEENRNKREQYYMDKLDNVINKYKVRRDKEQHKIFKSEYDKKRRKWLSSFGETCRDQHSLLRITPNLFL